MRIERDDFMVMSVPWKVRQLPAGDSIIDELCGKADFNNYTIWINEDMPLQERLETLVHELIHIVVRGRESCDLTKEDEVRTFSQMLVDAFLRNSLTFDTDDSSGW